MSECPICEREDRGMESLQMIVVEFGGDGNRIEINACKRCRRNIQREGVAHV